MGGGCSVQEINGKHWGVNAAGEWVQCSAFRVIDYDPDAEAPLWLEKLAEWFPSSPDMPAYLQRVAGYCAVGEVVEHCLFLLLAHKYLHYEESLA